MSRAAIAGALAGPTTTATSAARVRLLVEGSVEHLLATWDGDRGLFPFSSRLSGGAIVNDYEHPIAVRYTVNSLLGLARAAEAGSFGVSATDVRAMADRFLALQRIQLPADHGLLTVLLTALAVGTPTLREQVDTLGRLLRDEQARLDMQDLAWLLWGAAAASRAGVHAGTDVAREALDIMLRDFVDADTGLPRHTVRRYRRNVVSFGAVAYYLRALHEAAITLGDEDIAARFDAGVSRVLGFQGPRGEWPWMIDCRRGRPVDFYPVFAVHQDSMAMLFLHPALDRGKPEAAEAIARSLAWDFGDNELALPMFVEGPFFAYRCIERTERAPRVRRYLRSLPRPRGATPDGRSVRVNAECRSYHLGWILFVWAAL